LQLQFLLFGFAAPTFAATIPGLHPTLLAQDPLLDQLTGLWADEDLPALARALDAALTGASEAWAAGAAPATPAELQERARDAARLEVALVLAQLALEPFAHAGTYPRLFEGLAVPEALGGLRAEVAWATRQTAVLAPLGDWSFVGPFDNERGRGMGRPTPPEKEPAGARYPGKLREVEWRTTPALGPDGIVHLGRLVHPEEQACVLARTWIEASEARPALLLLGASEELRAWWNGAPLHDALGEHEFAPDAHTLAVQLEQGWNELVLKVGAQDGALVFTARLVEPTNGAPLALPTSAVAPEGVAPRALTDPGRGIADAAVAVRPGAFQHYAGREDAEARIALAFLRHAARVQPRKERPGAADAALALAVANDQLAAHLAGLVTARVSGALAVEEDVNPWLAALREASARFGDRPLFMHWYADHARYGQSLPRRALELIDRALVVAPNAVLARELRADLLSELGQDGLAELELERLVADPALEAWALLAEELLPSLPLAHPARARLRAAAVADRLPSAVRWQTLDGRLHRGSRDPSEVLAALASDLALDPWDIATRIGAAHKLLALGAADPAGALLDEAIVLCPEAPNLHAARARVLLAQGDIDEAQRALERVLELDLSADHEQRLLEYLQTRALAGAVDAPFHARFQEPIDVVLARHANDAPSADASAPRDVLLSRLVVEVAADGTARRYHRVVERVLSEAGAKELDRRTFRAFPGEQEVRVLTADVHRTNGTVDRARTGRTGARGAFVVDLPPLAPGDVVDFEWRHDDLRPSIFGSYFGLDARLVPDTRLAVRESEVVVLARPGVVLTTHVAGAAGAPAGVAAEEQVLADGSTQRTWRVADYAPRRPESLEPPAEEWLPRVQASTYASWEDFGRWWWNLIREELAVSPEMRTKVAELTATSTTPLAKLRAIYDFVVTDIRYNAWEFGINGYRPYSAPVIFSRRFGDCKDKAILMRAMLSEVGIEAWPVIIRAEGRRFEEDHAQALISHFNHCIAYVPAQEGIPELFLDGTARLHPLEVLPDSDRGARVIIVRDTGVETVRIPFPTAADNLLRERTVVDLRGEVGPTVTLTRAPSGRFDPRERHLFTGTDEARVEAVERLLTARFGALVGKAEAQHAEYEDLTRPVEVTLRSEVERIGRETAGGLELPAVFDPLTLLSGIATESERTTDLLLDVPWSTEREVVYELPIGAKVRSVPLPRSAGNEDIGYTRTVETVQTERGPEVIVRERFELKTHRVPAARYQAFREIAREVDTAQREVIDVEVAR
jgi:tetratricopeptide (TPR) repeat protein